MAERAADYIDPDNWTCPECGSARVQEQVWREVNGGIVVSEAGDDYWCDACYEDRDEGLVDRLVMPGHRADA